ncbi:HK97 family phage prohead protease [Bradyrhizobium sp. INPA03-11B]|uniref:HK97 family phage prohead protease n=1 Tax=Bradyrhizobium sp. INPA03-11B TaxID=418598 RepID=UPI0033902C5D
MKHKFFAGAVVKDDALTDRQIRVIVSTPTPDRVKDVMEPQGCDVANYLLNPVVLADHNPKTPIGKSLSIDVKPDRVEALIEFAPQGISAKADEYCGLAKAGILNTVSPGFSELDTAPLKGGGMHIKAWELLELSLVAVPAQPEALVTARSLGKAEATWKVGASRNLPIGEGDDWDGAAAEASIFDKAGFDGDDADTTFARKGFLAYDSGNPDLKGSYKLPFAKVIDGRLTAMPGGIRAAASRLPDTDIPDDVKEKARAVLDHYEAEMKKNEEKAAKIVKIKSFKRKDMYGVAQLAYLLSELGWIEDCSTWEAELEGDGSKVPAMLGAAMSQLGAVLVAMTQEEVSELIGGDVGDVVVVVDDDDDDLTKSLPASLRTRIKAMKSPLAKAFAIAGAKAGRTFSAGNEKTMRDACKSIIAGHDAIKAMLDESTDGTDESSAGDGKDETDKNPDTGKALPLSERDREIEVLRLKGQG